MKEDVSDTKNDDEINNEESSDITEIVMKEAVIDTKNDNEFNKEESSDITENVIKEAVSDTKNDDEIKNEESSDITKNVMKKEICQLSKLNEAVLDIKNEAVLDIKNVETTSDNNLVDERPLFVIKIDADEKDNTQNDSLGGEPTATLQEVMNENDVKELNVNEVAVQVVDFVPPPAPPMPLAPVYIYPWEPDACEEHEPVTRCLVYCGRLNKVVKNQDGTISVIPNRNSVWEWN